MPPFLPSSVLRFFFGPIAFCFLSLTGGASILINVDTSNSTAVLFSATGNAPTVDDATTNLNDGVSFLNFFTGDGSLGLGTLGSSTLTPAGNVISFASLSVAPNNLSNQDINLFASGGTTQDFSTSVAAFTGSATKDFFVVAGVLPGIGATGDIIAGDTASGTVIGQWTVIPEPSIFAAMISLFVLGIALFRRR